jgi:arylsulfatase A-like enzyme
MIPPGVRLVIEGNTMLPLRVIGALIILSAFTGTVPAESAKPNILLIVSDDQGFADVGFQGCKDIPTPNLDRLAASGLHCSNGYVTHPFCSPTRAGLMTGRYQQRFGHENNPFYDPADHIEGLPMTEKLLPAYLQPAGYATGWIGKWHLGAAPEMHPDKRGFAETFGFLGGGHHFYNWQVKPGVEYNIPIERNGKPEEVKEHLTLAFGHEGAAFVTRHKAGPWFLYLAFNAPHSPNEPTPERLEKFASIADPQRRKYAAQVSLMDDAIGDVLGALKETGQQQRTLVFFFSDNGGPLKVNGSSNAPLRGAKGSVYEGGMHVPFVISMPGTLAAGTDYTQPVSSVDVFATTLALAGVPMPADKTYDSVDLMPYLTGKKAGSPHDKLFWRTQAKNWAMRSGNDKFIHRDANAPELYDLAADLSETTDLAAKKPDDVARLSAMVEEWNRQLIPPAFPGLLAPRKQKPNPPKAQVHLPD